MSPHLLLDGASDQGEYSTSGREDICTGRERRNCGSTWVSSGVANLHTMNLNTCWVKGQMRKLNNSNNT